MGSGDLNLKKSWHPVRLDNVERVWKAEQKDKHEKERIAQLIREKDEERQREELANQAINAGHGKARSQRLEWMYSGAPTTNTTSNGEEFLLGKRIEKLPGQEEEAEAEKLALTSVPGVGAQTASSGTTTDLAAKIREDPMYLIKKRQKDQVMEIRNNPMKMKQLQELLGINGKKRDKKDKKEKKSKKEKHSKRSKLSKKRKHSASSDSADSGDERKVRASEGEKKLPAEDHAEKGKNIHMDNRSSRRIRSDHTDQNRSDAKNGETKHTDKQRVGDNAVQLSGHKRDRSLDRLGESTYNRRSDDRDRDNKADRHTSRSRDDNRRRGEDGRKDTERYTSRSARDKHTSGRRSERKHGSHYTSRSRSRSRSHERGRDRDRSKSPAKKTHREGESRERRRSRSRSRNRSRSRSPRARIDSGNHHKKSGGMSKKRDDAKRQSGGAQRQHGRQRRAMDPEEKARRLAEMQDNVAAVETDRITRIADGYTAQKEEEEREKSSRMKDHEGDKRAGFLEKMERDAISGIGSLEDRINRNRAFSQRTEASLSKNFASK